MKKNDKLLSKLTGLPDDVVIFDHDKRGDDVIEIYVSWYEPMGEDRICPECGSFDKDIIDGTDFFIKEVRILE